MLVHLVADYGRADLAFAEVQQRLALELPEQRTVADDEQAQVRMPRVGRGEGLEQPGVILLG